MRLLFYVSGHGFGHASRISALMVALRARAPHGLEIRVRSEAPHWMFTRRDPDARCTPAPVDVGILQPNGLDLDLPATLAAHEAFAAGWDEALAREAAAIADARADLVVADIPPLAFAAAARAGVPAVGIANFSWDWVLAGWADEDPRWRPFVARYREAYGQARALYRLPLHGDLSAFPAIVDVPLLVHHTRRSRAACRAGLGVALHDPRRLVLVSFGGLGSGPVAGGAPDDLSDYLFVGLGPAPPGFTGEWVALHDAAGVRHEELVHACDAVLGKPGYGTVAEALAHGTRFLYLPREGFREIPVLVAGLERLACARCMPREDFEAGRWRAHLDALFEAPEPPPPPRADGAEVIADALLAG